VTGDDARVSSPQPTRETATGGASCVVVEYGWASPRPLGYCEKLGTDGTFTNFHSSKNWETFRLPLFSRPGMRVLNSTGANKP
jgi:hypothetical protein